MPKPTEVCGPRVEGCCRAGGIIRDESCCEHGLQGLSPLICATTHSGTAFMSTALNANWNASDAPATFSAGRDLLHRSGVACVPPRCLTTTSITRKLLRRPLLSPPHGYEAKKVGPQAHEGQLCQRPSLSDNACPGPQTRKPATHWRMRR